MIYSEDFRINSHDCDYNGVLYPAGALRVMQEAANLQLERLGPTGGELRKQGKAFVISKLSMSLYRPIRAYEYVRAETWASDSRGVVFNRCSRIYRGNDLAAELVSTWALIDINDRHFYRVSDIELGFTTEAKMLELDLPTRIRIPPSAELKLKGEYAVLYRDVDRNMHMNNTRYLDMFCDYLPEAGNERVVSCSLNFHTEAEFGATVKIYRGESDGAYYFRSVKHNGETNAEAVIVTEK